MNAIAAELQATNPAIHIELLGINSAYEGAYNDGMTVGRTLPWLQDTTTNSVWSLWGVTLRDVRILDAQNRLYATYNLTVHDLNIPAHQEELKQLLLAAAQFVDTDADHLLDDWEMVYFGDLHAGPLQDADGDGQNNFSEYAFGSNPTNAVSRFAGLAGLTGNGSEPTFTISFHRRLGSAVDYFVEHSSRCIPWNTDPGAVQEVEPLRNLFDGTGTGQTTWRLASPVSAAASQFLRVRAVPRALP